MGTRGLWGFYKDGKTKAAYNHFDSYPEGLGNTIINFVKENSIEDLNKIFDRIILVKDDGIPTPEQIKETSKFHNFNVSTGSALEWYCILRETQGNPDVYKEDCRYMMEYNDFIKDSLFCEYAYIINLDDNILEFYNGYQKTPNDSRYNGNICNSEGYYPCKLIASIPFAELDREIKMTKEEILEKILEKVIKIYREDDEILT